MYAMVGDGPLGPFRVADPAPLLPDGMLERPYAGRIVEHGGRLHLLGTIWSDAGDRISDPIPVEPTATGVRWEHSGLRGSPRGGQPGRDGRSCEAGHCFERRESDGAGRSRSELVHGEAGARAILTSDLEPD
jgi:hypothetical protein